MADIELAINYEVNKQYIEAVKCYKSILTNNVLAPLDVYINLAFLYWEFAAEFTFNDAYKIPDIWSLEGGKKYPIIIESGLTNYPQSAELHFWHRYFSHRLFGDEFTAQQCERILDVYGEVDSMVPYFFLYLFDKEKYKEKRDKLLKVCEELPIAKNLYIRSIIEN